VTKKHLFLCTPKKSILSSKLFGFQENLVEKVFFAIKDKFHNSFVSKIIIWLQRLQFFEKKNQLYKKILE
jgi:hypothetical protein